mmetsp:Transcript_19511/g.46592  ORF Transcript_19511/g.46592 Transcript_19511/m.46592 type:complete len:244 (+) Transcript_19511:129-860(+)
MVQLFIECEGAHFGEACGWLLSRTPKDCEWEPAQLAYDDLHIEDAGARPGFEVVKEEAEAIAYSLEASELFEVPDLELFWAQGGSSSGSDKETGWLVASESRMDEEVADWWPFPETPEPFLSESPVFDIIAWEACTVALSLDGVGTEPAEQAPVLAMFDSLEEAYSEDETCWLVAAGSESGGSHCPVLGAVARDSAAAFGLSLEKLRVEADTVVSALLWQGAAGCRAAGLPAGCSVGAFVSAM